jgi:hypothetical protein
MRSTRLAERPAPSSTVSTSCSAGPAAAREGGEGGGARRTRGGDAGASSAAASKSLGGASSPIAGKAAPRMAPGVKDATLLGEAREDCAEEA